MRKVFTSLLLFFIVYQSFGQVPVVEWTRFFRSPVLEEYEYLNLTCDGGNIIVSMINEDTSKICLRKLSSSGKLE